MTDSFLLVVAPWIIFGVCLTALCIRLLRARRAGERSPGRRRGVDNQPEQEQPMRRDDSRPWFASRRAGRQ